MNFKNLRDQVSQNVERMMECDTLFELNCSKDHFWNLYLDSFQDADIRQEHTCNTCKSWLRNVANVVGIKGGQRITPWDNLSEDGYDMSSLEYESHNIPIKGAWAPVQGGFGSMKNHQTREDGSIRTWNHFYTKVPRKHMVSDAKAAGVNSAQGVLLRSINELKMEALTTVANLIEDNNLLRGEQFKESIKGLAKLIRNCPASGIAKHDYTWENATSPYAKVRNTAIGTLLVDLSDGQVGLTDAVRSYETKVGGANYKRKKALVTSAQRERFQKEMQEKGYSVQRRFAKEEELPFEHLLYTHQLLKEQDIFAQMESTVTLDPRQVSGPDVSIKDFMSDIGNLSDIEVMIEGHHLSKFAAIITGESPAMTAWDNPFSLSYTGGVADSIKQRVKRAGGNVDAPLRVSLSWGNSDDLDIHCDSPFGYISFQNKKGILDVDMNVSEGVSRTFDPESPVENLAFPMIKDGTYKIAVNNYKRRSMRDKGYTIEVEMHGQTWRFHEKVSPAHDHTHKVVTFKIVNGDIKIKGTPSAAPPQEKWGVSTNKWLPIANVMLSPNYWGFNKGNKHWFFHIRECKADEPLIGLFNEQVHPEIHQHHGNAVELLGELARCIPTDDMVCGLGFSSTQDVNLKVRYGKEGKKFIVHLKK